MSVLLKTIVILTQARNWAMGNLQPQDLNRKKPVILTNS